MKEAGALLIDTIRETSDSVDRSLMTFESACEVVSKSGQIADGFAAAINLINMLNNREKLSEIARHENSLLRILAAIRIGELLSPEKFDDQAKEWRGDSLLMTSLLRGMVRAGKEVHENSVLSLAGISEETDFLLARLLRSQELEAVFSRELLPIVAESAILSQRKDWDADLLLSLWEKERSIRRSLLYLADGNEMLIRDMLNRIDGSDKSLALMGLLKAARYGIDLPPNHPILSSDTSISTLRESLKNLGNHSIIGNPLVQFSFYGDPLKAGKGSSGGIGTFLRTLGNKLSETLPGVITVVPIDAKDLLKNNLLLNKERERHLFIYVPLIDYEKVKADSFIEGRLDVLSNVSDILAIGGIHPAQFHMRFSDYASYSMLHLANEMNSKSFFTITPDPQRSFSDHNGDLISLDSIKALKETSRVEISHSMVRECDRLFGIGAEESHSQLLSYYPQLVEKSVAKKLEMMPEGISLSNECPIAVEGPLFSILFDKNREFFLDRAFRENPLLLTIGRLDPAKGQTKLLKAWGDSQLRDSFNLVIIGGDIENPNQIELNELEEIRKYAQENRKIQGRFCHLPAMNNDRIRCLENSIAHVKTTPWPPIYVAPSFKEEFGIAILEAMAAGFVAIGPRRGGVKSYIRHEKNGFLMDTTNESTIRNDLQKVLLDRQNSARKMKMIAENGSKTVYRRYSISVVAKMFSSSYTS